ncbi:hypothetical protein [Clostridium sp.]|jgi:hypothetical protein|uniref:hypothetical protein n=1 Tax=Clostridium sp. TaxID=1506 RepID=UPI003EEAA4E6
MNNELKKRKEPLVEKVEKPTEFELLYGLKLHERYWSSFSSKDILRVPGGWLYSDWDQISDEPLNSVFVSFDNSII